MRQPDTSALRERLNNYTPEQELEEDKQELEGLLQEVSDQIFAMRNLLKEINEFKEELHGIHGSLMHTAKRERAALYRPERGQGQCGQHCEWYLQRHCKGGTAYRHPSHSRHG